MTPEEFAQLHNLSVSTAVFTACNEALEIMSNSVDPLHTQNHVLRMISDLHSFMLNSSEIPWHKVDFEILLLSICWHDTWKSYKLPTSKKTVFVYNQVDGYFSMRLFNRLINKHSLPKNIVNKTKYAIKKHSSLQFLPKRTLESKLLKDLDKLEEWSIDRIRDGLENTHKLSELSPKLFLLLQFYFKHWMANTKDKSLRFSWTKNQFNKRKTQFVATAPGLVFQKASSLWPHIFKPAST